MSPASPRAIVDAVIVAHDAGDLLTEAVASAVEQADADHVWVIDAATTDGSVVALRQRHPTITVVPVANNGFAAASNRGIAETRAPFVLLLNPDAMLLAGALDALLRTAVASPRAGIVGPLVLDPGAGVQDGSYGRFPTLASVVGLRAARIWRRLFGERGSPPQAPQATTVVDWVTGAAMLVRREAIDAVGLMDEGFFLYYEDVEWCHRMRDRGWQVLLEPAARVTHQRGGCAVPGAVAKKAYRDSFYRYCDLYGVWGLKASARVGLAVRGRLGGSP